MSSAVEETQLDKEKGREILDLKVKEVSVVDKPAILRQFLTVKRHPEEENMGAFESEPATIEAQKNQPAVETDAVIEKMSWQEFKKEDVDKALPIDLRNAIAKVTPLLQKMAGEEGAPKSEITRVVAFLGKVAGGKYPYPSPAAKAQTQEGDGSMTDDEKKKADDEKKKAEDEKKKKEEAAKQDKCPKCGADMKDGACTKCDYKVAAAAPPAEGEGEGDKKKEEEEKKKPEASKGLSITLTPEGGVEISGQPIGKAGKQQFTGERVTALKSSVNQMLTMLAQVDVEAAKSVIESLVKSTLPADVKWTSGTTATPASVKKAIDDALAPVVQENVELKKRLEDIEKSRPAPKSEGGDGDTEPGKKVEKSDNPWKGLGLTGP